MLAWEDEAELLSLAHENDFILVDRWLAGTSFLRQRLKTLPSDQDAKAHDFDCCFLARELGQRRRATRIKPAPGVHLERHYAVGTTDLPVIEWSRTSARRKADFRFDATGHTRLYIGTDWNYGPDQEWMPQLVDFYDLLVKRVKKLTTKIQGTWYVSKRFGDDYFRVPGLIRGPRGWEYHWPNLAS